MTIVVETERTPTRLFIAWQDPDSRAYHPVAVLRRMEAVDDDYYVFRYLKHAEALEGFTPFVAFPDLHAEYRSHELFSFFVNRVMSSRRPDYPQFLATLGLTDHAGPIEILARLGARATDSVEVFADPEVDPSTHRMSADFFVRGIRHVEGAEDVVDTLGAGDLLRLVSDSANTVNRLAIHVATDEGSTIGWVPDYLVDPLRRAVDDDLGRVAVTALHVNPHGTPRQTRVLCRFEVDVPPGFVPFDGPDFVEIDVVSREPHNYKVEFDGWKRDSSRVDASQARLRVYADGNYFQFFIATVAGIDAVSAERSPGVTRAGFRRAITDLAVEIIKAAIVAGDAPRLDNRLAAIELFPRADEAVRRATQVGGLDYQEGDVVTQFSL
jgi:hypothetical protein